MTDYKYAEPKDAQEALERIDHWMGDLGEFQSRLGLHDPGNDREPYYPKYSGSALIDMDILVAMDQQRYPEKWLESVALVPPLRDDWLATLIRTRDEAKQFIDTWTDLDHVKAALRTLVKDTTKRVQLRLLSWLGEKPLLSQRGFKPLLTWSTSREPGGSPYDPDTFAKVQRDIATAARIERGDDEDLFT